MNILFKNVDDVAKLDKVFNIGGKLNLNFRTMDKYAQLKYKIVRGHSLYIRFIDSKYISCGHMVSCSEYNGSYSFDKVFDLTKVCYIRSKRKTFRQWAKETC